MFFEVPGFFVLPIHRDEYVGCPCPFLKVILVFGDNGNQGRIVEVEGIVIDEEAGFLKVEELGGELRREVFEFVEVDVGIEV